MFLAMGVLIFFVSSIVIFVLVGMVYVNIVIFLTLYRILEFLFVEI